MHLIDEILAAVRLRGTVYFRAAFRSPWGMALPDSQVANFHLVCAGTCWLSSASLDSSIILEPGDMVLCPRGDAHELRDVPESEIVLASDLISQPKVGSEEALAFGGDGDTTVLICGHYEYNRHVTHPLFDALPAVVCVKAEDGEEQLGSEIATMADMLANVRTEHIGSAALDRLAEALFICCVRSYTRTLKDYQVSFVAAAQDKQIGKVLSEFHRNVARDWHLQDLAALASMSRSVFAERFRELVGISPMIYVARWRMLRANQLLRETEMPVARVAEQVGYQSEFAFAKAFKKNLGLTPGEARKRSAVG